MHHTMGLVDVVHLLEVVRHEALHCCRTLRHCHSPKYLFIHIGKANTGHHFDTLKDCARFYLDYCSGRVRVPLGAVEAIDSRVAGLQSA